MLTSYAQNFEDIILWRALKGVPQGFYIDIGAQDPVTDSVSLLFYEHGWRGVHVEPSPAYARALRQARPDEVVIEAAVSNEGGDLTFFEFEGTGLSTCDRRIAERHINEGVSARKIEVGSKSLAEVLNFYAAREIHWLKIDVEGHEDSVIESWGSASARPWIVVVESTEPRTNILTSGVWEPSLLSLGYIFAYFDGLNRFYVSDSHRELLSAFGPGPNLFDEFVTHQVVLLTASNASSKAELSRLETDHLSFREMAAQEQAKYSARYEAASGQIEQLRRDLDSARDQIRLMQTSTSWRISAPVRIVGRAARSLLLVLRPEAGASRGAGTLAAQIWRRLRSRVAAIYRIFRGVISRSIGPNLPPSIHPSASPGDRVAPDAVPAHRRTRPQIDLIADQIRTGRHRNLRRDRVQ